jgi:hypothetical protein
MVEAIGRAEVGAESSSRGDAIRWDDCERAVGEDARPRRETLVEGVLEEKGGSEMTATSAGVLFAWVVVGWAVVQVLVELFRPR